MLLKRYKNLNPESRFYEKLFYVPLCEISIWEGLYTVQGVQMEGRQPRAFDKDWTNLLRFGPDVWISGHWTIRCRSAIGFHSCIGYSVPDNYPGLVSLFGTAYNLRDLRPFCWIWAKGSKLLKLSHHRNGLFFTANFDVTGPTLIQKLFVCKKINIEQGLHSSNLFSCKHHLDIPCHPRQQINPLKLYAPPPTLSFCLLLKIIMRHPYLKIADAPMKKNQEI